MDLQKEREVFQKFCEENFDFEHHEQTYFDEQTQCYENDIGEDTESINMAWSAWQAAKAQAVPNQPTQFNLDELLEMEEKLKHKGGVITADLDRFIAYAESVLIQAKALKEPK